MDKLSDFLGIAGAVLAILFFIYPKTRDWLQKKLQSIFSPSCVVIIIIACLLGIIILIIPPTVRGVQTLLATPTPLPTPTPTYTMLLYDAFDTGASPIWTPLNGNWQMVNNRYTMTDVGTNWTFGETVVGNFDWNSYPDYYLGVQVNLPSSSILTQIDNQAEILVRFQDSNNYLALILNNLAIASDAQKGYWVTVSNGQATVMESTKFAFDASTFNLDIEVKGDIVTTFINGSVVSRWSGAKFLSGGVGLAINSRSPGSPPSFDNFYVRTLSQ